jgi:hypothetical protein
MTNDTPITDAVEVGLMRWHDVDDFARPHPAILAAFAAATLTGPLVEDVICLTCGGGAGAECPTCLGVGTVRLVVHVVTPETADWAKALRMVGGWCADVAAILAPSEVRGGGPPTGAERYLNDRLRDPQYRQAYDAAADLIGGPDA